MNEQTTQRDQQNEESLRRLILTVEANSQSLELIIAICDDRNVQAKIIEQYEEALREKGIAPFRVRLNPKKPSLKASVAALVTREERLRSGEPAVVTVLNTEALLGVTLGEETSEQERFFFSLQWTREALLRFNFAIVLWVPEEMAAQMGRQAPDFWSWRGGVFEFKRVEVAQTSGLPQGRAAASAIERDVIERKEQPIEELLKQVRELKKSAPESALLVTLYNDLGKAYERRYAYGKALAWYEKALALAEEKNNLDGRARALFNMGDSLRFSGRPIDSIDSYKQALAVYQKLGNRQGEAASLGNLGLVHDSLLGQYQQAIEFHQQSLEIAREIGDRKGEAASLGNLGNAHDSLGQYQQAIEFHQQSLEIKRAIGDRQGEARSLGNLGNAYDSLGQYQQAIEFHQQSLEIKREIGDRQGEAISLGNLGFTLIKLEQKEAARTAFQEAKQIFAQTGQSHYVDRCDEQLELLSANS